MSGIKATLRALYTQSGQRHADIDVLIGHLIENKRLRGADLRRWQEEQMQKKIQDLERMLNAPTPSDTVGTDVSVERDASVTPPYEGGSAVSGARLTSPEGSSPSAPSDAPILRPRSRLFSQVPITEDPSHEKYMNSNVEFMRHAGNETRNRTASVLGQEAFQRFGKEKYEEMEQFGKDKYGEMVGDVTTAGQQALSWLESGIMGAARLGDKIIGGIPGGLMGAARMGDKIIGGITSRIGAAPNQTPPVPEFTDHYESYNPRQQRNTDRVHQQKHERRFPLGDISLQQRDQRRQGVPAEAIFGTDAYWKASREKQEPPQKPQGWLSSMFGTSAPPPPKHHNGQSSLQMAVVKHKRT